MRRIATPLAQPGNTPQRPPVSQVPLRPQPLQTKSTILARENGSKLYAGAADRHGLAGRARFGGLRAGFGGAGAGHPSQCCAFTNPLDSGQRVVGAFPVICTLVCRLTLSLIFFANAIGPTPLPTRTQPCERGVPLAFQLL